MMGFGSFLRCHAWSSAGWARKGTVFICMHKWIQQCSDTAPGLFTQLEKWTSYYKRVKLCEHKNRELTRPSILSGFVSSLQRGLSLYLAYRPVPQSATTFYCNVRDTNTKTVECVSAEAGQREAEWTNKFWCILVNSGPSDSFSSSTAILALKVNLIQKIRLLVALVNYYSLSWSVVLSPCGANSYVNTSF